MVFSDNGVLFRGPIFLWCFRNSRDWQHWNTLEKHRFEGNWVVGVGPRRNIVWEVVALQIFEKKNGFKNQNFFKILQNSFFFWFFFWFFSDFFEQCIIFLTRGIKKAQRIRLAPNHHSNSIIIENCWNVFTRKFIRGVGDQETRFTDCTISDNNALDCLHLLGIFFIYLCFFVLVCCIRSSAD